MPRLQNLNAQLFLNINADDIRAAQVYAYDSEFMKFRLSTTE